MTAERGVSGSDRSASIGRPLRVAHLDHTSVTGGAELALLRMLRAEPTWSAVVLVAPPTGHDGADVYAGLPAEVPHLVVGVRQPAGASRGGVGAAVGLGLRLAAQAIRLRAAAPFRHADLVDANTARAAAFGALAVRLSHKPFVVHLRDLVDPGALGRSGHALMVRVVLPRADGVVANSRATLESARPYLRPGAVAEVIPSASGLRPAPKSTSPDAASGCLGPVRTVGMVARIDPWKGQQLLLEAFATAFRVGDARLQFAGRPLFGHEQHLDDLRRRAAELGIADRVDFLGHVDEVAALIADWDVAVQASTRPEPLGQNVLQYLAAGRAVIAADEGGPREWIVDGENGLLVPPRDVEALAAALRRLDADAPLRARLADAASRTPGLLDDAAVAEAHAALYRRVIASVDARRDASRR